ncbi:hypothetical protein E2C01_042181 [Portunus trituberculatus]|uniref:Uncharacterized protein n=1 Tax=Portunus trituberculatus TaxID=210409 RepID=A0A5B7FSZ5_PORTR|nr:hypothetical protein [Portunus trituberculatus]
MEMLHCKSLIWKSVTEILHFCRERHPWVVGWRRQPQELIQSVTGRGDAYDRGFQEQLMALFRQGKTEWANARYHVRSPYASLSVSEKPKEDLDPNDQL